jgi:hypothetical protein
MNQVRMAKPKGETISEMRDHIRGTPLHQLGDAFSPSRVSLQVQPYIFGMLTVL